MPTNNEARNQIIEEVIAALQDYAYSIDRESPEGHIELNAVQSCITVVTRFLE